MRPETVAESFATYRDRVLPKHAPDTQVIECQRAFYAGTYFMLMNLAYNIGDTSVPEEQGVVELEKLKAEIEAFAASGGLPLPTAVPPPPVVPDINYTVPDPMDIQSVLKDLGCRIGEALPASMGFALLLFDYGAGGNLFYLSSGDRADVITAMREFMRRQTQ